MRNNIPKAQRHNAGIYQIRNLTNGKIYIGQTIDFTVRYNAHNNDLKKNKHCNKLLQRDYQLAGEHNFEFSPIYVVGECIERTKLANHLLLTERDFIRRHQSGQVKYGYNVAVATCSSFGTTRSPEFALKIKLLALARAKLGPIAPVYKLEEHPSAIINNESAKLVKILIAKGWSNYNIAQKLTISPSIIGCIRQGVTWKGIVISDIDVENYSGELFYKGGRMDEIKNKIGLFLLENKQSRIVIADYLGCSAATVSSIFRPYIINTYSLTIKDRTYLATVLPLELLRKASDSICYHPGRLTQKNSAFNDKLEMVIKIKILIAKGWNNMEIADYLAIKPYMPTVIRNERAWGHISVSQQQIDSFFLDQPKKTIKDPRIKLDSQLALTIKKLVDEGKALAHIAADFGLHRNTVAQIKKGVHWSLRGA